MLHAMTLLYWTCRTFCSSRTHFTLNVQALELYSSFFHRLGTHNGMKILLIIPYQSKSNGFLILFSPFPTVHSNESTGSSSMKKSNRIIQDEIGLITDVTNAHPTQENEGLEYHIFLEYPSPKKHLKWSKNLETKV